MLRGTRHVLELLKTIRSEGCQFDRWLLVAKELRHDLRGCGSEQDSVAEVSIGKNVTRLSRCSPE